MLQGQWQTSTAQIPGSSCRLHCQVPAEYSASAQQQSTDLGRGAEGQRGPSHSANRHVTVMFAPCHMLLHQHNTVQPAGVWPASAHLSFHFSLRPSSCFCAR
jgi:hypothetical protein